jgi:hypothetical protein
MKASLAILTVAVASMGFASNARAWGPEGHALVADMAEAHLDEGARTEVARLLALDDGGPKRHLDEISSWADEIRSSHPETGTYHYVDIPLHADGYDEQRDCHFDKDQHRVGEATCVVAKLPFFIRVLADKSHADKERLEALKWIVHLVGDIHQPLHAEDNHDKGGNGLVLTYNGVDTNLHAVWDLGIIEEHYAWQLGWHYSFDHDAVRARAAELDSQIQPSQRKAWAPANPDADFANAVIGWANDSHALAQVVYAKLPAPMAPGWDRAYQDYAWPVVQTQLDKAGVRLAAVLNQALK